MTKQLLILGSSLLWALQARASESGLVTAVKATLTHNAGLQGAAARLQEAEAARREVRYSRLPNFSARTALARGDNPVFVFGSLLEQGRFGPQNFAIDSLNHPSEVTNIKSALDVGVPIFTGFALNTSARQSELAESQARSGYSGTEQGLRFESAAAYFQLLLTQSQLENLDQRIQSSSAEIADAQKLKERGVVLGSDFYAAEAILSGMKGWRVQVQTEEATVQSKLAILSGRSDWVPEDVFSEQLEAVESKNTLIEAALSQRPDLSAAVAHTKSAELSTKQIGRTLWPRVNAFATLETNTHDFSANPSQHMFGVAANLPFGDPAYFARKSRVAAAEASVKASRQNLEDLIRMEVAQAYESYRGALAAVPIAKETRDRASKSLDLFRPLYRAGRQSIMEVLRAEEALARAQAAYQQALFQAHLAYLRLHRATGSLDDRVINGIAKRMEKRP